MGFSAGVMLVASFIALLIPSMQVASDTYGNTWGILPTIIGLAIGYQAIIWFHNHIPHEHLIKSPDIDLGNKNLGRVTLIISAICLHNIPEGLSVGVGFGGPDLSKGLSLGIAIAIQNMPEGLVVALGLISIGASKHKAFCAAMLSGLVEPVAAIVGYYTTQISVFILPFALAFSGGAMLFVICQEMFPELFKEGHEKKATQGLLLGIACMLSLDYMFS